MSTLAERSRWITSRLRLGVPEEQVLALEPFSTDDGVALFYARAQEANIQLDPSGPQQDCVREIVTRLDGISLAIELSGARCALMSPKQLLARLSKRFQLLQTASKDKTSTSNAAQRGDWS